MKINRVSISNFKNINNLIFDFRDKDVLIFDGPNGFGKTSFFDAVELVVSGKINRITNTRGKGGFDSLLLLKNQEAESLIKIEFIDNGKPIVIARKTNKNERLSKNDKKPDNWEVYHAYKLTDFEDENYAETKLVNQKEVNHMLGNFNYDQLFNIFFYVQQEETGFYLKMTEKKRMDSLSILFNTDKQIQEKEKTAEFLKELKIIITTKKEELKEFQQRKNKLEDIDNEDENAEYVKVSPEEELIGNWDSKEVIIDSSEKFHKHNDIIDNIILLKENMKEFRKTYNNQKITQLSKDTNRLQNIILFDFYRNNHEEILENYSKLKQYINVKGSLNEYNSEELDIIPLQEMKKTELMGKKYFLNIETLLERKKEIAKHNTKVDSLYANLISARDNLKNKFEDLHNHSSEEISDKCPYCGADYNSYDDILENFEDYKEIFNDLMTTNSKYLKEINESIIKEVRKYLEKLNFNIETLEKEQKLMEHIKNIHKNYIKMENDLNLLNKLSINFEKYQIDSKEKYNQIDNITNKFENYLINALEDVDKGYNYFSSNKTTFQINLNSNFELLEKITIKNLNRKKEYFKTLFLKFNSKKSKELLEKIDKYTQKIDKLKKLRDKLTGIINIYNTEIAKHENNVAQAIEIPFHIYSAKIIKNQHFGSGFFFENDVSDNTSKMRFISKLPLDHDAINYLSSGQLSALVISFSLALNKSYKSDFNSVLIDDPAQTLDELNLYSFIDLLAREFNGKQFFFSTHESDKAQFIEYKFDFYGFNTKRVNMKLKNLNNQFS